MKKVLMSMMLILAVFLAGCQNVENRNDLLTQSNSDNQTDTITNPSAASEPLPSQSIEIRGIEKLNEMRDMLSCDDSTQVDSYIQSMANSGVQSKEELLAFVKIMDSLPMIPVLDGNITWIRFSHSISEDTGKDTNVVYITTEAANGDWTRVEYVLSVTDVSQKISEEKVSIGENCTLNPPVKNAEGNLTLYAEARNPHSSGKGTMIQWIGDVDGIFTRIYYFTSTPEDVEAGSLFNNIQISKTLK